MSSPRSCIVLVIVSILFINGAESRDRNLVELALDYGYKTVKRLPVQLLTDPENRFSSLTYELYTPSNPKEACFIEPTPEEFDNCPFNPNYETKFLIMGFLAELRPGGLFDDLRDALLDYKNYNIIYVDWSLYNKFPLLKAIDNIPKIGQRISELIHFMMNHMGVKPQQLHCIGHSLGAHVCGHVARRVPKFSRVTGLDPGGITITRVIWKDILLKYTDADFVDVIHTSFIQTGLGLGLIQPIGHLDFYVNGGIFQNSCKIGRNYRFFSQDVLPVITVIDQNLCDHIIPIVYFINSVHADCEFLGTKCNNVLSAVLNPVFKRCPTNSSITAKMGFHSRKILGLPPKSVFYVDTLDFAPYCKRQK